MGGCIVICHSKKNISKEEEIQTRGLKENINQTSLKDEDSHSSSSSSESSGSSDNENNSEENHKENKPDYLDVYKESEQSKIKDDDKEKSGKNVKLEEHKKQTQLGDDLQKVQLQLDSSRNSNLEEEEAQAELKMLEQKADDYLNQASSQVQQQDEEEQNKQEIQHQEDDEQQEEKKIENG